MKKHQPFFQHDCGCGCHHEHRHSEGEHEHHDHCHCEEMSSSAEHCRTCGKSFAECTCALSRGATRKIYILENLGCANCAAKMERKINALPDVEHAVITYATKQLCVIAADH
ncbi:MAG: cation transporter, partial [Firmicutes bacterium]|nr:cation transporter [Bacillota bacterium]